MTQPKPKPVSRGARDLAEKLLQDDRVHYFSRGEFKYCPSEAAALIDEELREVVSRLYRHASNCRIFDNGDIEGTGLQYVDCDCGLLSIREKWSVEG